MRMLFTLSIFMSLSFLLTRAAEWIGDAASTTGVSFPYNGENFPTINPRAAGTWEEPNYKHYPRDDNAQ
jgi:endoglucanase